MNLPIKIAFYLFLLKKKIPSNAATAPKRIHIQESFVPSFPAKKMEVGPSELPMTETEAVLSGMKRSRLPAAMLKKPSTIAAADNFFLINVNLLCQIKSFCVLLSSGTLPYKSRAAQVLKL